MTVRERSYQFKQELEGLFPSGEIATFYFLILDHLKGFSRTDLIVKEHEGLTVKELEFIDAAVARLKGNEPIQYIIGQTEFYGLPFLVNPSVLIPRPETEELVQWVVEDRKNQQVRIIDICCGSGCIGVALKANLSDSIVELLDVSEEALEVARKNAQLNGVDVVGSVQDILTYDLSGKYDVIVSNPPYVRLSEQEQMHANVLAYEPHLALFVEDDDPLLFYRRIGALGLKTLNAGGALYFEINEAFGEATKIMLEALGYRHVTLRKDLNGRDRMLKALKC